MFSKNTFDMYILREIKMKERQFAIRFSGSGIAVPVVLHTTLATVAISEGFS